MNDSISQKDRLRQELKVQLPVPIDSKKYLIGNIAFIDIVLMIPFFLLSLLIGLIFFNLGILNLYTMIVLGLPVIGAFLAITTKHPIRRELAFWKYYLLWNYQYRKRNKEFFIEKGALKMTSDTDTRAKIGIKNVFANCYETTDKYFVKVYEVGSLNTSLMDLEEEREVYNAFKGFMTTLNFINEIQFEQIASPISLEQHLMKIEKRNLRESNPVKVLLNQGYVKSLNDNIQKSRELITRKRYVIFREKIGSNREKSLNEISTKGQMLKSKLENVTFAYTTLQVTELKNDDLIKLMFVCVDYDNAVSVGDEIIKRASDKADFSIGEVTAKNLIETLQKNLTEKVN